MTNVTTVATADILITDGIARMVDNPSGILERVVEQFGMKKGGKTKMDYQQFQELWGMLNNVNIRWTPGGSSANTFYNIGMLMPDANLDLRFLGIAGTAGHSHMIMSDFKKAGIRLIPPSMEAGEIPQAATSIVVVFPDGERTIATYPGNAKEIITPDRVPQKIFEGTQILFMQGGAWEKFRDSVPGMLGVADKMVDMAWEGKEELWLAMPTSAFFAKEQAGRFQYLVSSAQVIVGNGNELSNIMGTKQDEVSEIQRAEPFKETLESLQNEFGKGNHRVKHKEANGTRGQWGFATFGKWGSAVVTSDGISYVPSNKVEVVNTLGAGDTAFGGFLAARLSGLGPEDCARVAMALAAEKCKHNGPRLPDPLSALKKGAPEIASMLLSAQGVEVSGPQGLVNNETGQEKV